MVNGKKAECVGTYIITQIGVVKIQHSYIKTFLKRKHQDTGKCDRCLKAYKHFYHLCMFQNGYIATLQINNSWK